MSCPGLFTTDANATGTDSLTKGESLINGQYRLTMQHDANLVLYENDKPIWASDTMNKGTNATLVMQGDGNLVIYDNGKTIWQTNTAKHGNGKNVLLLQSDGNLVIYSVPYWSSKDGKLN